jgi:hypothetical protein
LIAEKLTEMLTSITNKDIIKIIESKNKNKKTSDKAEQVLASMFVEG